MSFTHSGRQRPLNDIITDLSEFILNNPYEHSMYLRDPGTLVGLEFLHRFELTDDCHTVKWYKGTVLQYDKVTKEHTIMYEDEDSPCSFDLVFDL